MSLPFIRCYLAMKEKYLLLSVHLLVTLSLARFILETFHSDHLLVNHEGNKHNTDHVLKISTDIWLSGGNPNLLHFGACVYNSPLCFSALEFFSCWEFLWGASQSRHRRALKRQECLPSGPERILHGKKHSPAKLLSVSSFGFLFERLLPGCYFWS